MQIATRPPTRSPSQRQNPLSVQSNSQFGTQARLYFRGRKAEAPGDGFGYIDVHTHQAFCPSSFIVACFR